MSTETQQAPDREEAIAKLRDLIKGIDIAMLTTIDTTDGTLRSRPMSTNGDVEFDGDIWFFTYASAHKVDEIEANPQVNAAFARPDKQDYVSLSGKAELVKDRTKIEELWKPQLKAWFPKGTDDPDIALLKVSVEKAEYWDAPASVVAHAIGLVKATLTGKQPQLGEDVKLDLR